MGMLYEERTYRQKGYSPGAYSVLEDTYQENDYVLYGYGDFGLWATGERVKALQRWLNQNLHTNLVVDGLYGSKTMAAVRKLQEFCNLTCRENLRVDGLYGCRTYAAVLRHYREAGWTPPPPPPKGDCGYSIPTSGSSRPTSGRTSTGYVIRPVGHGIYATGQRVALLQDWLNRNLNLHLKVDGLYGAMTRGAVLYLQKILNRRFGERLVEDGYYGTKTYAALLRHYVQAGWTTPPPPVFGKRSWWQELIGKVSGEHEPPPEPIEKKPAPKTTTSSSKTSTSGKTTTKTEKKTRILVLEDKNKDDKIFGIEKKYVIIGGFALAGLVLALLVVARGED